ncbi:hypothetical protein A9179_10300 [Pseudomonas alcaligenes]|uniref:Uncharacterized protein n=1 Tax=Aquipseudomonas alcaligenes TaxID=43263 RepID=A0ABR7S282_AQUAC|nr:hypothetical protein [Pseudomonas alcaligenes]
MAVYFYFIKRFGWLNPFRNSACTLKLNLRLTFPIFSFEMRFKCPPSEVGFAEWVVLIPNALISAGV